MRIRADEVTATTILNLERGSIRAWVESCSEHLTGRVLDYGCGEQPYAGIVAHAGGFYVGHDLTSYPSNVSGMDWPLQPPPYDAILCTQVMQYVPLYGPAWMDANDTEWPTTPLLDTLDLFRDYLLARRGWLVLTGGTCWREIEPADHSRLTVSGARALLELAGFRVERCESRAAIDFPGFSLSLGWGALAQA